jgi:predicted HTH domain antitoxin
MSMVLKTVTTRLPPEVLEEIEGIAERDRIDRSELIRRLLDQALAQRRIDEAVDAYRNGKVTMWRAAEMAGVSLREMMSIMNDRRIELNYTLDELERDLEYANERNSSI